MISTLNIKSPSKKGAFLFITIIFNILSWSQEIDVVTTLDNQISETSGLIQLDNRLITHNDSGGEASLFEIDIATGKINRTIEISNATNIDWEDITHDDKYIYIGDFGNNNGTRTDLTIYIIDIQKYLAATNSVDIEGTITFNYRDQEDFTPNPFATNFDAEAMISQGDFIYVFTKNWVDLQTNVYRIPKTTGSYEVERLQSFPALGLITGATLDPNSLDVILTGYTNTESFLFKLSNINFSDFSTNTFNKNTLSIPENNSLQIEGITTIDGSPNLYITAEAFQETISSLYEINSQTLSNDLNAKKTDNVSFSPNPAIDFIKIDQNTPSKTTIKNLKGQIIIESTEKNIDIEGLDKGTYFIQISTEEKQYSVQKLLKL